jgi:hypothetical protein
MKEKTTDSLCAGTAGALATSKVVSTKLEKHWRQHDVVVPMARMITDMKGMSPRRIRNGDTSVGCMGLAALRMQQCNMKARRQPLLHNSNKYTFPHQQINTQQ